MGHIPHSVQALSLKGIKRRAKALGKQQQIPHTQALNLAAQLEGYESFHHARRSIARTEASLPAHSRLTYSIYLSAYWRDSSASPRKAGLETIKIELPRPLAEFLKRHQIHRARNLESFFLESEDHLEMRSNLDSQDRARELLQRAALTLQFIEATGLRPATNQLQRESMEQMDQMPNRDHVSRWISPHGDWLFLDEPYSHAKLKHETAARQAWLSAKGLHGAWPAWGGLYYPTESLPHFSASNSSLLKHVVQVVENLPPVIAGAWQQWPWISDSYYAQFISPAREASGRKRKARPGTTYSWSKNAVAYRTMVGHGSTWRPNHAMSLDNHRVIADELKRLGSARLHYMAYNKLQEVRSELENWLFAEVSGLNRDPTDDYHNLYYGGESPKGYLQLEEKLAAMDRVRAILVAAYPDCKPLRDLLKVLDAARKAAAKVT
ncbi:DUF5623 domain-containing protein [Pseudomonas aeruginosa]|uniref:DUF5623 domain-containing protein n=1 Tax=Pseudomonas aeruginosa TaxID=287 RepID=UPI0005B99512|nr:DUF5623 domain-containing protein [Pseudomonas aeruginosa]EIU3494369.1 DUF5623 domain-containing protein [Pseudomonas aeruginosa]KSN26264.1 hypothetical protein APA78_22250 [Pseudomonas aeruginosa]MBK1797642.1 DUF5623 domain-containing protein [Pseudomonas aeruginosa]HCF6759290.1 DUF5623 domain-containing protein [Pseudomonas aeruginosa]